MLPWLYFNDGRVNLIAISQCGFYQMCLKEDSTKGKNTITGERKIDDTGDFALS